jgi:enoyl-CoA hydratase/carnithine racemase
MRRATAEQVTDAIAAESGLFLERLSSPEAREAFGAFLQKRKPDFSQFS